MEVTFRRAERRDLPAIVRLLADDPLGKEREQTADGDERAYTTATGGGSTSDVITAVEAAVSLALTAGAVAAGWRLAAPRGDGGVRADGR